MQNPNIFEFKINDLHKMLDGSCNFGTIKSSVGKSYKWEINDKGILKIKPNRIERNGAKNTKSS